MAMNIDSLIRIKADVQGENNIRRLGNSMQGVQGKVKNLKMSVQGLTGAMRVFGTVLAAGAFTQFLRGAINLSDEMGKASVRTGVAADKLLALKNAGMLADVSQQDLINSLTKLNVNMVSAAEGNEELAKRFQQLGISIKRADGQMRDTDEVLKDIADRFADMPDGAQKAAAAVTIFGRSGAKLITLLNGGAASLDEFNYKLSDDFAPRAELFNDTITKMGFQFEGFRLQLMDALLPALQVIAESFGDLFASENDWKDLFAVIEGGIRGVAIVIMSLVKLVDEMVRAVVAGVRITKRFLRGDIKGMEQARTEYFQGVGQRFGQNVEMFERLRTGRAEAPTQRKRTSMFDLRNLREERAAAAAGRAAAQKKTPEEIEAERATKAADNYRAMIMKIVEITKDMDSTSLEVFSRQATAFDGVKDAAKAYLDDIGTVREGVANLAGTAFRGLEDALTSLVTTGKANFLDFTRTILQATARMIIQQTILRSIMQALGAIPGGALPTSPFGGPQVVGGGTGLDGSAFGASAFSKIIPFAPFADGGIINKPTMSLMGEAGPEAVLPLKRGPGGKLGVASSGGVGDVVVNVDAGGSNVQGNDNQANQLGKAIGAAVQAELIKQKKPGGLLA